MQRLFDFLRTDDLPRLTRTNYVAELRQMSLWGIVAGAVEGSMAGVVVSKTFAASSLLTTIVCALPILMNVINLGWSTVIRGRPRKPAFFLIAIGGLLGVASIGLVSSEWKPWGGWMFAAQIGLTHLFLSGLITLRTTMWKVNYPPQHRAKIAGRLQTVRMLLLLLTTASLSLLFNRQPESYRWIYPFVALIGVCSLVPLRRLRMRGEPTELKRFRRHIAQINGGNQNSANGLWSGIREAGTILRTDRSFARYMVAQFFLGSANFFTDPILVNVLTKQLGFDYFNSLLFMCVIPISMMMISIRFWARYFDRVGLLRFRIYNSACWVGSYICVTLSMAIIGLCVQSFLIPAIAVLLIGRIMTGLGRGGGAIAWNLGHLHFAREHQIELYMGIHVALTGLRGLLMPLLGWVANYYLGWGSFVIALTFAVIAHLMFRRMAAVDHHPPFECAPDREEVSRPGDNMV